MDIGLSDVRDPSCLFSAIGVNSPLEELEQVYEKKLRGLRSREDEMLATRLDRAYELARARLAAALEAGRGGTSATEVQ